MTIRIAPISALLGALLTFGAFMLMSQLAPVDAGTWGPAKKGVVNIFVESPGVVLQPGASHVVYQVPPDRWLTVTTTAADGFGQMTWCELSGGVLTAKGRATADFAGENSLFRTPTRAGGTVGWVFRPGSQVVLHLPITQSALSVPGYALIGFETRN